MLSRIREGKKHNNHDRRHLSISEPHQRTIGDATNQPSNKIEIFTL